MASRRWVGTSGGAWQSTSQWSPAIVPTSADDAVIAGPTDTSYQSVTGPGNAASLTLTGNTTLSGTFAFGMLGVGTIATAGALAIGGGSVVTAGSATLLYGPVAVSGAGAELIVTGALTLGGPTSIFNFVSNKLSVSGGGAVQAGSLSFAASPGGNTITIDSRSSLEIGDAGDAAAGKLVIDTGQTVTGTAYISAANGVVNNGTITAQSYLTLGNVGGAGQLQIGAGATLSESGTEAITFLANTGTLDITSGGPSGVSEGTISGFVQGDVIELTTFGGALTSATYVAGAGGLGTLTLRSNTSVLAALTLAGNYAGNVFQMSPSSSSPYSFTITLGVPVPTGGSPSAGTGTPDLYSWTGAGGGGWNDATRWKDVTTQAYPATNGPGRNNIVTLAGPSDGSYQLVSGPGNAAVVNLLGSTTLSGTFNIGTLGIGTANGVGALNIQSGSIITAGNATLLSGPVLVNGSGARLTVTGTLTLGGAAASYGYVVDSLSVTGGAVVQAGSLSMLASTFADTINVDSTSSLEVGAIGAAATGAVTVDAGRTVSATGTVTAANGVNNNGTIIAQGTLYLGTVTGTGQLQIAGGGSLFTASASAAQGITFLANTGTLNVTVNALGGISTGPISGFGPGDTIAVTEYGAGPTSATYTPTSAGLGTLTVRSNTTVLGAMTLVGNYAGDTFQVSPSSNPYTSNITVKQPAAPASFAGTGHSDVLLQNDNGAVVIWSQANLAVTAGAFVGNPGSTWHTMGVADFNGDGHPDLLLQNNNGAVVDYLMNGTTITAGTYLGNAGPSWHVRGAADFGHDGNADILLQNDNGAMVIWTTNGSSVTAGISVGNPGASWTVEGVADFDGDGQPDLLLQNSGGGIVDYLMNGSTIASGNYLGNPGPGWAIAGTGDYNGDSKADILLHNDNGADVVWDTNGSAVTAGALIGNPGPSYTGAVAGLDLNGDRVSDLVVQNTDSSVIGYTLGSGGAVTAGASLGVPGVGWHAVGNNPVEFIDGTQGNANLAATPGADQFDLTTFMGGLQRITGFDPVQDSLALSAATYTNIAGVQANEYAYQGGTLIELNPATNLSAVLIQGVTPGQLSAANYILH